MSRPKVIVESAFRGSAQYSLETNVEFAERLCARAIRDGFNPFASHLFYTRFLDDFDIADRATGMGLGLEWGVHAQQVWICIREGEIPSTGMLWAISRYLQLDKHVQLQLCHPDGELIEILEEKNKR